MRITDILKSSQILFDDRWCQLRRVIKPECNINGYTFLHEIRCNGQIISIMPYKIVNDDFEFLVRKEATPCWELETPILSSITGGIDKNDTKEKTAVKELEEETGYKIYEDNLIYLGTCYGTKSSSTTYHLFSANLTECSQSSPLYIETELDRSATCQWITYKDLILVKDPYVFAIYTRLTDFLFA